MVKRRRRKLGRRGDNLVDTAEVSTGSEPELEVIEQEHSIEIPSDVARHRSTASLSDEGVRARRRRLGLE